MIAYPVSFPCVSRIEGHSAQLSAGLVRTPMEAGNSRQRRAYRTLPHQIALVFMVDQSLYAGWLAWANTYAWDNWVGLTLPGLEASRAGVGATVIAVRFMSDLQAELVPVARLWLWRVRVTCEYLPSASLLALGGALVAGSPGAASAPDWVIGGTAPGPSTNTVNPGTLSVPAGYF